MKFEIQQEDLQKALDTVASVVPSKTTLPILTSILCEAAEGLLRLSATNLDISISTATEAVKIAREGKAAIPAAKLVTFVRNLPAGPIKLEEKDGQVFLAAGHATLEEASMNVDEYPALPELSAETGFCIAANALVGMVVETSYAVSRDETRPALMGILWEVRPDSLTLVATDAHRLALSRRKVAWDCDESRDLIVDTGGLKQISRITANLDSTTGDEESDADKPPEIEIFLGENQISFRAGPSVLHARMLEGPFPEYQAVLPRNNDKQLLADRELLAQAVRRVSITADRLTSQIKLGLESGRLELEAKGTDGSRAKDEIEVSYEGDVLEIGFNFTYLQDILKNLRTEQVQISLRDPQSAALIEPVAAEHGAEDELLCLLMPLRLAND